MTTKTSMRDARILMKFRGYLPVARPGCTKALYDRVGEEPELRADLVAGLFCEIQAAKKLEDLTCLLRCELKVGSSTAFLLDEGKTLAALRQLERALELLWDEAAHREAALPRFELDTAPNPCTIELVDEAGITLRALKTQPRSLPGANAPRSLAELTQFRERWAARVRGADFGFAEIAMLLGQEPPSEQAAAARLQDAVRTPCARQRACARERISGTVVRRAQ